MEEHNAPQNSEHIGVTIRTSDFSMPLLRENTCLQIQLLMNPKHLYSELWLIASSPLRGRFSLKLTEAIHGILTLPHFKRPFSVEMVYAMKPLRDIKEKATEKGFHMSTVHDSSSHLEFEIIGAP